MTGLYYLNARYYDSATGRFISADSYRGEPNNPWTWNEYGYCDGNPVVRGDKSGHFFNLIAGAIGAAVGAVVGAAVTLATDLIEDGQINKPASEYLGNAASGAIAGLAAGVTCGASLVVTAAVIGTTAVAGNVVGQAIIKGGFDKVNVEDALLEGTIAVASFGLATKFGPVIKQFGAKIAKSTSKVTSIKGGRFADVDAIKNADEVAHHMAQNAYNNKIGIRRADGPALLMSKNDHALTRTFAGRGKATMALDNGLSAKKRLAKDIKDVRKLFGNKYNEGIKQVKKYSKTLPQYRKG